MRQRSSRRLTRPRKRAVSVFLSTGINRISRTLFLWPGIRIFGIGSGLAGLYHVANEAEDRHFKGGRYGVLAEKLSQA
jgi:hypothetical protein